MIRRFVNSPVFKKYSVLFVASVIVISTVSLTNIFAIDNSGCSVIVNEKCMDRDFLLQDIGHYDPTECTASSTLSQNKDYNGNDILTSAQVTAIAANASIYKEAGSQTGVPWQMIAVIHLRETGLKRENPSNGQGVYQEVAAANTNKYPVGPVDDAAFLAQSVWAGNFLKGKSSNPAQLASGNIDEIKDTFFGYNGRAGVYQIQAESLGFTKGADGSPYVMNKADSKRDPVTNPTGWGQIKLDGGSIEYPANSDYGAYVVYASLVGGLGVSCGSVLSGDVRSKIVTLAQQELTLWDTGKMSNNNDSLETGYKKYTYGIEGDWCAWFVSWVLKQAGAPVNDSDKPYWSYVRDFDTKGQAEKNYIVHPAAGYTPKPGDFAIYSDFSHINIVTAVNEKGQIVTIGGNQAGTNGFTTSKVTTSTGYANTAAIEYISID